MTLVEEIEAAAKRATVSFDSEDATRTHSWDDCVMEDLMSHSLWPRIKKALLAAEEMDNHLRSGCTFFAKEAGRRFRAANGK